MSEEMQKLISMYQNDTQAKRAKLYGLALLRTIDNPRKVSRALKIGTDKSSYIRAFRPLYQEYAFVFTDETHQFLHPDIRAFLRQQLQMQRQKQEVAKIIAHIYENQQQQMYELEEEQGYHDLRMRLRDEEWIETCLDLLEAQFWADPCAAVSHAISFLLAASLYHPHLVHEIAAIGSFFADEMEVPQRKWWSYVCWGFGLFASSLPSYEKMTALYALRELIERKKLGVPVLFAPYSQQLLAASWWQEGELYREFDLSTALTCYSKALPLLYSEEQVPSAIARLYWIMVERITDEQVQIDLLTQVIEHQPDCVDAYVKLGDKHFDREEYQLARTYYQYAIELQPHHVNSWINLGVIHTRLKEYQRALDELNYAENLTTIEACLYFNRGNVYRELKMYAEALKDFDRAIELDNTYINAYTNRGNIYASFNMPERASQDYEQAIRLKPDDMQALWLQEWIHFGKQRVAPAVAQRLREIATYHSTHYLAATCRGIARGLTEKVLKLALPELERGCQAAPDQWDAYFWLAMIAVYCGHFEQAKTALYKAVELGLPTAFLLPLYWLEKDRPDFFQRYARPLLQEHAL